MVRKLGPIGNLLGMLPGTAQMKEQLSQVNDKDLDRIEAIVRSMTPTERRNPKIINGSRRARIAGGSGVAVGEVSQLVTNFFEGQKQMKAMFSGGIPGMPPGMNAMARRAAAKSAKGGKKGKKKAGPQRRPPAGRGDRARCGRPTRPGRRSPGRAGPRPRWPRQPSGRLPGGPDRRAGQAAARPELPAPLGRQRARRVQAPRQEEVTPARPRPGYCGARARTMSMVSASAAVLSSR